MLCLKRIVSDMTNNMKRGLLLNEQTQMLFLCRSMGILLPPVAQVTSSTGNHLTLHHRNRSLDSALQRIPEVDVTPSPECETVTTLLSSEAMHPASDPSKTTQRDELASLGSDDSGILCGSDSGSSDSNTTRESSVEYLSNNHHESRESLDSDKCDVGDGDVVPSKADDGRDDHDDDDADDVVDVVDGERGSEASKSFGMLRLLESKVFDVSMAMHYLFKSKEPGVQSYIANKMFSFDNHEVDFYLPQLVCMYIQMHDVAEVIHPYLIHR